VGRRRPASGRNRPRRWKDWGRRRRKATPASQPGTQTVDPWQSFAPVTPGIVAGQFTYYPSVTAGAFYDDNVFASSSKRQGAWGRHRAAGDRREDGRARITRSRRPALSKAASIRASSSENQINGAAGIAATAMVQSRYSGWWARRAMCTRMKIARAADPSSPVSTSRWPITSSRRPARSISATIGFGNSVGLAGSWILRHSERARRAVDQSYRDGKHRRAQRPARLCGGAAHHVFVEWAGNRRNFNVDLFRLDGYRVVGGVLFEQGPGAVLKAKSTPATCIRITRGITFDTVSTYTYGGVLAWLIAPRWTAGVRRQAQRAGVGTQWRRQSGRVERRCAARLSGTTEFHWVGGGATYLQDDFSARNAAIRQSARWSP